MKPVVSHVCICRMCRYWQPTALIHQGYCTKNMKFTSAFHVCLLGG